MVWEQDILWKNNVAGYNTWMKRQHCTKISHNHKERNEKLYSMPSSQTSSQDLMTKRARRIKSPPRQNPSRSLRRSNKTPRLLKLLLPKPTLPMLLLLRRPLLKSTMHQAKTSKNQKNKKHKFCPLCIQIKILFCQHLKNMIVGIWRLVARSSIGDRSLWFVICVRYAQFWSIKSETGRIWSFAVWYRSFGRRDPKRLSDHQKDSNLNKKADNWPLHKCRQTMALKNKATTRCTHRHRAMGLMKRYRLYPI